MRARQTVVLASVLAAAVLGGAVLIGCGGKANSTTPTVPTTEVPTDMKATVAAQVFTAMNVQAGASEGVVTTRLKEVTEQNAAWVRDPNVTLGTAQGGKITMKYKFTDGSTLKVVYATEPGAAANMKLAGAEFTKP